MSSSPISPQVFVIFGVTGDLARRKLLPALRALDAAERLPEKLVILGTGRGDLSSTDLRLKIGAALISKGVAEGEASAWCARRLRYQRLESDDFGELARRIERLDAEIGAAGRRVLYLALPPEAFPEYVGALGAAGLAPGTAETRLVIEKPFGRNLASARELNSLAHQYFSERQIYRIDHYLGKDTVQNLLTFRFANSLFESAWNRDRVESVEISSTESVGIENRAAYYESSGALRDMVQNHLTQVLALVAMEPPTAFSATAVRDEKIKVLDAITPIRKRDVVFGQYASGHLEGRAVAGYLEEQNVAADSRTETYVAMRVSIANWRWQGVPFYLRTGKRMSRRITQVAVTFKRPPICLFKSFGVCETHPNVLLITLQPEEGFSLFFDVKQPGEAFTLRTLPLRFRYSEVFDSLTEDYQTLLIDVLRGDQTLFVRGDEVETAWRLYESLLEEPPSIRRYAAGSAGPMEAEELLVPGHRWQDL